MFLFYLEVVYDKQYIEYVVHNEDKQILELYYSDQDIVDK